MRTQAGFSLGALHNRAPDELGGAAPVFFEKCLKFLTLSRRAEAFPRLSCSPVSKQLLEIGQCSGKAFLETFMCEKESNVLELGENDKSELQCWKSFV